MSRTVAVLGGGVGGLAAARELRSRLPREDRVVLVERSPRQHYSSLFLRLMVGECEAQDIARDISWITRRGIELLEGEILEVDPEGRAVETSRGRVAADALVVALGAERTLTGVLGAEGGALEFYSLAGAKRLGERLQAFPGGRVVIAVLGTPYSCPAAPYEAAFLLEASLRRRGLKFEVQVVTPEPYPMPTAGPAVGEKLRDMLLQRGISLRLRTRTKEVRANRLVVEPLGHAVEGEAVSQEVPFDLLIAIPLHRPPEPVARSLLGGFVSVDPATLATSFPGVWALGDVTSLPLPGRYRPDTPLFLPKAGVFAHRQAEVVADQVAAYLHGGRAERRFDGVGFCFLEVGEGQAGFGAGRFFAQPAPDVRLFPPARKWYLGKELFARTWLAWMEGRRSGEALGRLFMSWAKRHLPY